MNRVRRQTERVLNLLIALRSTRGWMDRDGIRRGVEDYSGLSDQAFDRQFSRDKALLDSLGIDVETATWNDPFTGENGYGYRITDGDYALTEIAFSPEEAAAISVARTLLDDSAFSRSAATALDKLRGHGPSFAPASSGESAVRLPEPVRSSAFRDLLAAASTRRAVTFDYRRPGESVASRRVEPYAVLAQGDRTYLRGFDLDRGAVRVFRLSRIASEIRGLPGRSPGDYDIPADVDVRAPVVRESGGTASELARIAVAPGSAVPLRERALRVRRARSEETAVPDGWEVAEVPVDDPDAVAAELLPLTPHVRVLAPEPLVRAHIAALTATRDSLREAADGERS